MLAMKSAAVLLLALSICSGFAQEGSLKLTHTIPLNGIQSRFDHFAMTPKASVSSSPLLAIRWRLLIWPSNSAR